MKIGIEEIKVQQRKRKLDNCKVQELAESFANIGQLQPITVAKYNGMYRLVAGLHRLEAAKQIGWRTIEAMLFEGDEIQAELAEVDENLMRNDLTVLEQGEHLARRQELLGYSHGGDRKSDEYQEEIISARKSQSEIAAEIGLTDRSARNRMQVARNILPEVKELIRDTPVADSITQLLELARMKPEKQIEVARQAAESELTIEDAKKAIRQKEIIAERREIANSGASVPESERWHVWQADIATWIAPRKYDFIITDPPYPKEYLPLWETLAIRAKEWLKPGGLLIAMSGQSYLNEIYAMMDKHLKYYWTSCFLTPERRVLLHNKQVMCHWKPLLVYSLLDDNYNGKLFDDVYNSPRSPKDNHEWEQSEEGMLAIIKQVCLPGQYILDPFCGSGTTGVAAIEYGCLFDGIDIEIENVNISKARLNGLQN